MTDPRLDALGSSANDELLMRAIRHAVLVGRMSASEARRILKLLDEDVLPDLADRLASRMSRIASRGFDSGFMTTQRYRDMIASIRELVREETAKLYARTKDDLRDVADSEAKFQVSAMNQHLALLDAAAILPPASVLQSIVTSRPMNGALLRDWFARFSTGTQREIQRQVNIGIVQGESTSAIAARVASADGVAGKMRNNLESIVRTAVNHVSAHAKDAVFRANTDLISKVMWVSTLSLSTCPVCALLDGQTFDVESGPRPPAHVGCRCTMTVVLKTWRQLGVDAEELSPGTRASMSGQVPATTTYRDWFEGLDPAEQNQAFGTGMAQLYRDGRISLEDTVRRGSPLSLERVLKLEGIASSEADLRRYKAKLIAAGRAAEE